MGVQSGENKVREENYCVLAPARLRCRCQQFSSVVERSEVGITITDGIEDVEVSKHSYLLKSRKQSVGILGYVYLILIQYVMMSNQYKI